MDKDSEIRRLREFVRLHLRREIKGNTNEKLRIPFLSKESVTESGARQAIVNERWKKRKNKKNNFSYVRDQKRTQKIREEIGRSYHSHRTDPYKTSEVLDDISTEIYPIDGGYYAEVFHKENKVKKHKMFREEAEAEIWIRTTSLELSNQFTQ